MTGKGVMQKTIHPKIYMYHVDTLLTFDDNHAVKNMTRSKMKPVAERMLNAMMAACKGPSAVSSDSLGCSDATSEQIERSE